MKIQILAIFLILFLGMTQHLWAEDGHGVNPFLETELELQEVSHFDISIDGLFSAGYFSERENLQWGAHDPNERGFNLQNLELTMAGVVDSYFRAEGHLVFGFEDGESIVEVEEVYMSTLKLPYGLEMMAGQFFTRFGRMNTRHPHAWDFVDQTVVNTVMFGGEGLRNLGLQVSLRLPTKVFFEFTGSVQNAKGETASSFLFLEEETFAGRPITTQVLDEAEDFFYMGGLKTVFDLSGGLSISAGTSHILGPNGTGPDAKTRIHGIDFFIKWQPLGIDQGGDFVTIEGEVMQRYYEAGSAVVDGTSLPEETFKSTGFYLQSLYGFTPKWVAGIRYDQADASQPNDPRTGDRWRVSPNLTFYPSEFSKIRIQYNYDHSDDFPNPIHVFVIQYGFTLGAHDEHQH